MKSSANLGRKAGQDWQCPFTLPLGIRGIAPAASRQKAACSRVTSLQKLRSSLMVGACSGWRRHRRLIAGCPVHPPEPEPRFPARKSADSTPLSSPFDAEAANLHLVVNAS